jgi:hypothetical protein
LPASRFARRGKITFAYRRLVASCRGQASAAGVSLTGDQQAEAAAGSRLFIGPENDFEKMQNLFASSMLIAWPLLAIYLFATQSLTRAILWTLMGAQMVLPAGAIFKFEMIPQFDKFSIPNLCVLIGCFSVKRQLRIFNGFGLPELLIIGYIVSPVITSQLNGDAIVVGNRVLPGVGLYDALSAVENALIYILPFFIGRQFFRTSVHIKEILCVLATAGLLYSAPMLFEVRMSPNLQPWIYGFAATDFVMTARDGGYRPMVFMGHGLVASFFMMTTAVASTALWVTRQQLFRLLPSSALTGYLSGVLLLCKSFGALLYGIVLVPAVRWTGPRIQMRVAVLLVSIALLYPALRSFDLFPAQSLLQVIYGMSDERGKSLGFRFANEDKLLQRAFEKPFFGWGRYGRNRVYNQNSGADESVTDGLWVLTIGQLGLVGFIAQFGLLSIGVFRAASSLKLSKSTEDAIFISTISLIVAANIVELIPNSGLLPWTWLLCGALLGRAEALKSERIREKQGKFTAGVISQAALKAQ